jgi:predicted RNA binding protein YcfA (HicA-like mRNA interferase family)
MNMRLPRDLSGRTLVQALSRAGYTVTRQKGSHLRLTTRENGEHHITIPDHDPLRIGTLSAILNDVAEHLDLPRDELLERLFV